MITHYLLPNRCLLSLLLLAVFYALRCLAEADSNIERIATWYGEAELSHTRASLLTELLSSQPIKRLKHINQYGIMQLVDSEGCNNESYTRYDHSLGVFYLLNYFEAPFAEQVSGLLHDVSHTAFSHVSDYLFSANSAGDPHYHDSLFYDFLAKHGIVRILKPYGLTAADVSPENVHFTMLERDLPDLCADRLDYILQGAARRKTLTRQQVNQIIKSLSYDRLTKHWYFSNQDSALLFAGASLELNQNIFVTAWGRVLYQWTAEAVRRMVHIKALTLEDISYRMGDDEVWQSMLSSTDTRMVALVEKIKSARQRVYETKKASEADVVFENLRCRIVNPRVILPNGWKRLSDISPEFKDRYKTEMKRCSRLHAVIKTP